MDIHERHKKIFSPRIFNYYSLEEQLVLLKKYLPIDTAVIHVLNSNKRDTIVTGYAIKTTDEYKIYNVLTKDGHGRHPINFLPCKKHIEINKLI